MTIHRLLYSSEAALRGSDLQVKQQVSSIVGKSCARNAAGGLTGALLFASNVFVQVLEGPIDQVEATFERICCDLRHRQLRLFELIACEERVFRMWSMAELGVDHTMQSLDATIHELRALNAEASSVTEVIRIMHHILTQSEMHAGIREPDGHRSLR